LAAFPQPSRYLEIGVDHGYTLETIRADQRYGVDPTPAFDTEQVPSGLHFYSMPSDDFFNSIATDMTFNLVFVDGLHEYEQAYRDVINAFTHLASPGIVVLDDVVPADEISAMASPVESLEARLATGDTKQVWHGNTFVVLAILRDHHPEIVFRTIVGSGNEQAVMWLKTTAMPTQVDTDVLSGYQNLTYASLFGGGIPGFFNCADETTALHDALSYCTT
jgi:hypothetical protein